MIKLRSLISRQRKGSSYRLPELTASILDDLLTWDTTRPPLRDALRFHLLGMLEGEYNRGVNDA